MFLVIVLFIIIMCIEIFLEFNDVGMYLIMKNY